ncbi:MAG: hypothetical protein AB2665_14875 [Candidatus Thiodiazotropha sp.]
MIEDHKLAEELIARANEASRITHDSLWLVMNNCSQAEFKKYRLAVAHVMAEIFEQIVTPLSQVHPDLDPLNKPVAENAVAKAREDVIPAYDPNSLVVLERLHHILKADGSKAGMNISIMKPAKSENGEDWYCTWQVASEFGHIQKKSFWRRCR